MQILSLDMWTAVAITVLLSVLIVLGALSARADEWFWPPSEARKEIYAPVTHFFAFVEHWGIWALVGLNIFVALAMTHAYRQWNLLLFFFVFIVMQIVSVYMMKAWADGDDVPGKRVLSAFSRDGLLTVTGVLLTISMAIVYTVTVMYFLTPGVADGPFPLFFALALTAYLPFGLLQPPLRVWNDIHNAALMQWLSGTGIVWALYVVHVRVLH